ncbi:amidohydrolase family protein [Rubripirellula reticaptiva]|uniref:amidohydrolase family protein n=1 Tax=Rubripirellula reticaptiva TaxID=2528013 RepID=UPI001FEBE2E0|nr:amidohydrolase family protein [Rubripirellula reticaptiva]
MSDSTRIYTARWILPIASAPIEGGWIRINAERIVDVSSDRPPIDAIDLGNVAVLPGLVNSHTHLEFSDLSHPIGQPNVPLPTWIGKVVTQRGTTTNETKNAAIEAGLRESAEAGVCLIGEITSPPCNYPVTPQTPAIVSLAEVLGLSDARSSERFAAGLLHNEQKENGGWSPHAPYSTTWATIERCVAESARSLRPLAMHVAESPSERELLSQGTGPFADALHAMGVWRDDLFPWGEPPFDSLIDQLALAHHALLVHGNDLRSAELQRIATYKNLTLVYCPRTHAYFGYAPHPVAECLTAGIRVALGTDSRASNPDLNLWSEVQFLLNHRPDIDPAEVLKMATLNGATALGRLEFGRIQPGCSSAMGTITTSATTIEGVFEDMAAETYHPIA